MPNNTYKPIYEKIYRFTQPIYYNSLDEVNIPLEELEVFYEFQGNNIQIHKYIPLKDHLENDPDGIIENIWLDFFLDADNIHAGTSGPHHYCNHEGLKGYKQLHKLHCLFVKIDEYDYTKDDIPECFHNYGIVDIYMRLRRVKIKEV